MVKIFDFNNSSELSSNTYVIGKINESCIIIDLGSQDKKIYEYVSSHYSKCLGILLTHGHFDHIRGIPSFLKSFKYNIPVYIHHDDVQLLNNPVLNSSTLSGHQVKINIPVNEVNDNQIITLDKYSIKVIHTPYHTKGSVCYLFEEENALFTGDTLFKESIGRDDLMASKPSLKNDSLKKLVSLNEMLVIYPGHGEITNLKNEKQNNPYLKEFIK